MIGEAIDKLMHTRFFCFLVYFIYHKKGMGIVASLSKFFIAWGIKYLILFGLCLLFLEIPYEKLGPLMLVVLIATVASEVISRLFVGGM